MNNNTIEVVIDKKDFQNSAGSISKKWEELCDKYLPVAQTNSIWRYSRHAHSNDLDQGWKLHLSATILTANEVLEKVSPVLKGSQVLFKAPSCLQELMKINAGIYYGYSQVGKFITVYPRTNKEALFFADQLHRLTCHLEAPAVPFDIKFKLKSNVYYRFGLFRTLQNENLNGKNQDVLRDPFGNSKPDSRESGFSIPDWTTNPFPIEQLQKESFENPLQTTYKVFRSLAQRGKGGVYQALNIRTKPANFCVIKEGRKKGETGWDGSDGYSRVENEERALSALRNARVNVSRVYDSFEVAGNYYLVTEFIKGNSLQQLLNKRKRRLPVQKVIDYAIKLSRLIAQIHAAGWVWRDCKPANILITKQGILRPVDFEGSCKTSCSATQPWATPFFAAPELFAKFGQSSNLSEDLFALGAVIYLLFEGRLPVVEFDLPAVNPSRKGIPNKIKHIILNLLDADPRKRPEAQTVARFLEKTITASS